MRFAEDKLIMLDGTKYYCYAGIVGLSRESALTYGYDGGIDEDGMPVEHKIEIAEHMIEEWTRYKERLK